MAMEIRDAGGALIGWELEHTAQQVDNAIDSVGNKADQTALDELKSALDEFKDGYEILDLWNHVELLYEDKYVNLVDGHVRYDDNAYGLNSYLLRVDGSKKYTAQDGLDRKSVV